MIDWTPLRRLTAARIGLQRTGVSVGTADYLAFRTAHALARDAVQSELDVAVLAREVAALGLDPHVLASACTDTHSFLTRPDLGRRLSAASQTVFAAAPGGCDVVFTLIGGLSARGVATHAAPLLAVLLPRLQGWRIGPACLVGRGRVALGDEIGAALNAAMVVVLIGERPGLSAPDSLGAYLTWQPRLGRRDAERNCISNIRPEGLPIVDAAARLLWLMMQARSMRLTGVGLKDESGQALESRNADCPVAAIAK